MDIQDSDIQVIQVIPSVHEENFSNSGAIEETNNSQNTSVNSGAGGESILSNSNASSMLNLFLEQAFNSYETRLMSLDPTYFNNTTLYSIQEIANAHFFNTMDSENPLKLACNVCGIITDGFFDENPLTFHRRINPNCQWIMSLEDDPSGESLNNSTNEMRSMVDSESNGIYKYQQARYPNMISYESRVASMFGNIPSVLKINVAKFCKEGVFLDEERGFCCFYCGLMFKNYKNNSIQEHVQQKKKCLFIDIEFDRRVVTPVQRYRKRTAFTTLPDIDVVFNHLIRESRMNGILFIEAVIISKVTTVVGVCVNVLKIDTNEVDEEETESVSNEMACICCFKNKKNIVSFPCRHQTSCFSCLSHKNICSTCLSPITHICKVFIQ